VAASSAVPGLLSPIGLENFAGSCGFQTPEWLIEAANGPDDSIKQFTAQDMLSFLDREKRPWLHLVDGGISDNLGLRTFWTWVSVADGLETLLPSLSEPGPRHVVIILVNAMTKPEPEWLLFRSVPSLTETLKRTTEIEIGRYDLDTVELVNDAFSSWVEDRSTPDHLFTFDFVQVGFAEVADDSERTYLNGIGTNFDLSDEQVDRLIAAAREVLRESPAFQTFLARARASHATP
jgi:NTE family protein